METTKTCTQCHLPKPATTDHFKRAKRSRDGLYPQCKECEKIYRDKRVDIQRAYNKQYYTANKPKMASWAVAYHQEHKDVRNEYSRSYYAQRRLINRRVDILTRVKSRAKKLGIPFDLTIEDIVIPETCPILGTPIVVGPPRRTDSRGPRPDSPSLDRIDPTRGYVKGNVCVISNRANTIKCNATVDELEIVLNYMKGRKP